VLIPIGDSWNTPDFLAPIFFTVFGLIIEALGLVLEERVKVTVVSKINTLPFELTR